MPSDHWLVFPPTPKIGTARSIPLIHPTRRASSRGEAPGFAAPSPAVARLLALLLGVAADLAAGPTVVTRPMLRVLLELLPVNRSFLLGSRSEPREYELPKIRERSEIFSAFSSTLVTAVAAPSPTRFAELPRPPGATQRPHRSLEVELAGLGLLHHPVEVAARCRPEMLRVFR